MNNLREINIANRTCYYYVVIIIWKIIWKYFVSYETFIGAKPMPIRFVQVNGFVKVYDGTRYLVLFSPEKYYAICNGIRYLISQKKCYYICLFS